MQALNIWSSFGCEVAIAYQQSLNLRTTYDWNFPWKTLCDPCQ